MDLRGDRRPVQRQPLLDLQPVAQRGARTDRRDKGYVAPALVRIEDNKYDNPDTSVFNSDTERMYRRRILRTVIDMRNLG